MPKPRFFWLRKKCSQLLRKIESRIAIPSIKETEQPGNSNPHRVGTQSWAAVELGVTFEHLNRVLNGHRKSRSLMRRYNELMESVREVCHD